MAKRNTTVHSLCADCGARCCRYVATQIDTPTCKRDYDNIRWYLRHERVAVFIDHDHDWYLEFETPCRALGAHGRCLAYATRPRICREHGETGEPCEFHSGEAPHTRRFTSAAMFERYLDARGIDWRWKRL
jgi:uncharacterized protein